MDTKTVTINQPKSLSAISRYLGQNVEDKSSRPEPESVLEYFRRLRDGEDAGNRKEVVSGNLEKWQAFDWSVHPKITAAKRVIVDWSRNHIDGGGIILSGDCGSGKSHIAQAVAAARGPLARFVNEVELVKAIQATYGGKSANTEEAIISRLQDASLLVYDDLGTYEANNLEWLQGIYYALFNGRKEARKATMITTNLPLIDHANGSPLEARVGARTFSRILGQVGRKEFFIDLFGVQDYRLRMFE